MSQGKEILLAQAQAKMMQEQEKMANQERFIGMAFSRYTERMKTNTDKTPFQCAQAAIEDVKSFFDALKTPR